MAMYLTKDLMLDWRLVFYIISETFVYKEMKLVRLGEKVSSILILFAYFSEDTVL